MRNLILGLTLLLSVGCMRARQRVEFQFVNLSTNEIHSDEVLGMPPTVAGGWLPPRPDARRIDGTVIFVGNAVHIGNRIKIIWQERGGSCAVELKRDALGLPAELKHETVRFTYLGDSKWSVELLK